jgi:uncharacterized protein with PIN domain
VKKKIEAAVVDSSALICISKVEPAANFFLKELGSVGKLYISAATHAEVILATLSLQGDESLAAMEDLIGALRIETVGFGAEDIQSYKDAAIKHHLKARPPGPLNMGDVFSFQLAIKMKLPLFFQGKDFLKTPVKNAMAILGYEMNEKNLGVPTPQSQYLSR